MIGAGVLFLFFAAGSSEVTCGTCHKQQAATQPTTSMAHALELVADCAILREHPHLTFKQGPYTYSITRQGNQSIYKVTDGTSAITAPIGWAFGLGAAGQTYVYERDHVIYESRVSFYKVTNGLDLTIGALAGTPKNLEDAAGRAMSQKDVTSCFGCHATGGVRTSTSYLQEIKPGVLCENCHPQAQQHMAAIRAGDVKNAAMPHLSKMDAEETSEFCGRCHRTWADISTNGPHNIGNIRFQPYRLTNSKCYDAADRRIRCTTCHDPHVEVVRAPATYDSKCLACHGRLTW